MIDELESPISFQNLCSVHLGESCTYYLRNMDVVDATAGVLGYWINLYGILNVVLFVNQYYLW